MEAKIPRVRRQTTNIPKDTKTTHGSVNWPTSHKWDEQSTRVKNIERNNLTNSLGIQRGSRKCHLCPTNSLPLT